MKKSAKVVLLASLLSIGLFQTSVSAITVTKSYRYDRNTAFEYSMNYHEHKYVNISRWSAYCSIMTIKLVRLALCSL